MENLVKAMRDVVVANRIHVVPPCIVTPAEARRGLEIIDEALAG